MPTTQIPFLKMDGLGNDFVVFDFTALENSPQITEAEARRICHRRIGIGADQILILSPPIEDPKNHARMEILNADGSTAKMCGNGIRAVALYLKSQFSEPELRIETEGGLQKVRFMGDLIQVDMGKPTIQKTETLHILGRALEVTPVDVGNPHAVVFVDTLQDFPAEKFGPALESHPHFPGRTNVEFVEVEAPGRIRVRVWERGAGFTEACGTGACAAAVASLHLGKVSSSDIEVCLPGGELRVSWAGESSSVFKTGPARELFRGQWPLQ